MNIKRFVVIMRLLVLCYFLFSEKAFIEIERKLN